MKIGYIRVSTREQNIARQEALMEELGVEEVFIDKQSGKDANRPELQKMMEYVRKGDVVIVESISRFARNTRDLLDLIDKLQQKEVEFVSKKESIDTTTPTGKFMLTIFGQFRNWSGNIRCSDRGRASRLQKPRENIKAEKQRHCRQTLRKLSSNGVMAKSRQEKQ